MAVVCVSTFLIEEWLFKGLDVEIRDAQRSVTGDAVEFSILGKDVPDCKEAIILCHTHQEKGCDRWVKVEIKAVPDRCPACAQKDSDNLARLGEISIG